MEVLLNHRPKQFLPFYDAAPRALESGASQALNCLVDLPP